MTVEVGEEEWSVIQEGMAKISFKGEKAFFYNEIQEFNRDLTVTVLRQFVDDRMKEREEKTENPAPEADRPAEPVAKKQKFQIEEKDGSIRILDALSASGLRALRFSQEVPHVSSVVANDFSDTAVEAIKRNVKLNGVEDKVEAVYGDAVSTMMSHRAIDKRFHAVDLDPYGSASPFLDSAVQCVADRGLLMVTCTDMATLCGNTPEACFNKYDSIPIRTKACHEMALRILLRSMDAHANRYTRYIEPLLAISIDFYIRVFVRVHTGARQAKDSATKCIRVLQCTGCQSFETVPILRKIVDGVSVKYAAPTVHSALAGAEGKCVHCSHTLHEGGPYYGAPIHSKDFVSRLIQRLNSTPEAERLGTHKRLLGVLQCVNEEIDAPFYFLHDQLSLVVKCTVPKMVSVRSAILHAGYEVSGSHCHPRAVKTNAPPAFLWEMCRRLVEESATHKIEAASPGGVILAKKRETEINFSAHPKAHQLQRNEQIVRFQCNKGKNWGPKAKAKGSVNSVMAGFQVDADAIKKD
ncbi:trm-1 [Pristionchus pacificus]|uniref:tRNA (guanine(26)-N(2))-dimethyltransferase n=1 Tax=Pristionchus pacificus TaxID=54126 RepID=A0A454Y1Q5_PRIPA|nr:trm-1 [Pristionchus pacificus]|eukprot:PDM80662.1 trm-1 [Pristionchus pacificus]